MMKITPYPIFFALLGLSIVTQTLVADAPTPWLDLVRQRLELEQTNPEVLVVNKKYGSEDRKHAFDHALVFYHDRFEKFYKDAMSIIDPCREWCDMKDLSLKDKDRRKLECKEWCDLKDYLEASKVRLDAEYINLKKRYRGNLMQPDFEDNRIKHYQADVKHYYDDIIDVLKKTTIEGQDKEVKLFKETVKEKRHEKAKEKRSDEADILKEKI